MMANIKNALPFLLMAGVVLLGPAASALAQAPHGMDVLAGIAQYTGECPKNPVESKTTAKVPKGGRSPLAADRACVVELPGYLKSHPEALLVDLRLPAEFDRGHAAGAINVSPAELLSKPYWRRKALLVLGKGKAEPELTDLCYALRENGYGQVAIADGGVIAWARLGLPWAGMALDLEQALELTPEEFLLEMQDPRQQLYVSAEMGALLKRYPHAAPLSAALSKVSAGAKRPARKDAAVDARRVIFAVDREPGLDQLRALNAVEPASMGFVYTGGEPGIAEHAKLVGQGDKLQRLGPKRLGCGL